MVSKRRILDYGLAGVLLLVPVVILNASLKKPEKLNKFDEAVLRISSPLQAVASWFVEGLGGLWNDYVFLVDVEDENEELRAQNLSLRHELAAAQQAATDAATMRELVGLKRRTPAETAGAHVVASSINSHFRVTRMRLDNGSAAVEVGMPVISSDGLVGRVQHVYGDYSDVLLVSDPQSSVDVVIPETGGRGLLRGLARDNSYRCEIEYLERSQQVKEGQLVVTSGLGEHFPAGLVVGRIASVDDQQYGLYQKVEVEPAVQLSTLDSVLILLAPPPAPDPRPSGERAAPIAHGMRPL